MADGAALASALPLGISFESTASCGIAFIVQRDAVRASSWSQPALGLDGLTDGALPPRCAERRFVLGLDGLDD